MLLMVMALAFLGSFFGIFIGRVYKDSLAQKEMDHGYHTQGPDDRGANERQRRY